MTRPLNQTVGQAIYLTDNEAATNLGTQLQGKVAGVVVTGYGKDKVRTEPPKISFERIRVSTTVSVKFVLN